MLEKTKQKETAIENHTKREKGATNNIYKAFKISPRLSPSLRNLVEFQNSQTTDVKQLTPEENPTTNRELEEEEDMMKVKNDFLEFVERIEKSDIDLSRTNGYVRKRLYKKRTIVPSLEEAETNSEQVMQGHIIEKKREALSEDIVMSLLNQFSEVKKITEENQTQIALTNQKLSQMDIMNTRYEQLLERIERLEKRDAVSSEASTEVTEKNLVGEQQERQAQKQLQNQHVETSQDMCKQDENVIEKIKQEVTLLRKERDYYRTCFIEMRSISKEKDALISLMRNKLESARKVIQVMTEKGRLDKADKEINVNEENGEEKRKEMKEDKITQDREEEIEREDKDTREDYSESAVNTTEQGEIKKEEIKTNKEEEEEPIQIEKEAEAHIKVGDHTKEIQTDTTLQGEKLSITEEEKNVEMNWVLESDMKEMERRHAIRQRMLGARQLDLGEVFDKERRRSSTTPPKALDRQEMTLYKERREEEKRSAYKEEKGTEGEHEKEETVGVGVGVMCNSSSAREQKEEINEIVPKEQINFESNMKTKEQKNWRTSKEFFYNSKIGALGLRTTTDSSFTQDSPSESRIRENRGNSFNRTKPKLRSSVGDKKHVTLGIKRLEKDHSVAEQEKETQEDMDQEKKVEIKTAEEKEEREKHNQKLVDEETTVGEEKPNEERERKQHVMRHSKEKKEKPKINSRQKDERREERVQKATSQKEGNESFEPFAIDVLGLLSPRQKKVENPVWKAPELFVDESNLSKKAVSDQFCSSPLFPLHILTHIHLGCVLVRGHLVGAGNQSRLLWTHSVHVPN